MKVIIKCWMNHHFPLPEKFTFNDLYMYIVAGHFFWKETDQCDQKVTITIEVEE